MTDDIKKPWMSVVRATQAACKDNGGIGVVTLRVIVNGNVPIMWHQPVLEKIHPRSLVDLEMSAEMTVGFAALVKALDKPSS